MNRTPGAEGLENRVVRSDLSITCVQEVGTNTVELSVRRDNAAWLWEIRLDSGQTLDSGTATTRVAGQSAAQLAYERRLKRAGLVPSNFAGYQWHSL